MVAFSFMGSKLLKNRRIDVFLSVLIVTQEIVNNMKRLIYIALAAFSALFVGCADLGFGVDVDSSDVTPYWYGNGYLGDTYWNTPVWNYGPIYDPRPPRPPRPPFIDGNPGPALPPSLPEGPSRPPVVHVNPGVNRIPTTVGGVERPGAGPVRTERN